MVIWPRRLARISIHALREESDAAPTANRNRRIRISIHALREESDYLYLGGYLGGVTFQSTLSVRRATHAIRAARAASNYFNPRSP